MLAGKRWTNSSAVDIRDVVVASVCHCQPLTASTVNSSLTRASQTAIVCVNCSNCFSSMFYDLPAFWGMSH